MIDLANPLDPAYFMANVSPASRGELSRSCVTGARAETTGSSGCSLPGTALRRGVGHLQRMVPRDRVCRVGAVLSEARGVNADGVAVDLVPPVAQQQSHTGHSRCLTPGLQDVGTPMPRPPAPAAQCSSRPGLSLCRWRELSGRDLRTSIFVFSCADKLLQSRAPTL